MYHVCAGAPRGQKWASDSLRAGVAGRCELPNTGTAGPLKKWQALLTAEPSLRYWERFIFD